MKTKIHKTLRFRILSSHWKRWKWTFFLHENKSIPRQSINWNVSSLYNVYDASLPAHSYVSGILKRNLDLYESHAMCIIGHCPKKTVCFFRSLLSRAFMADYKSIRILVELKRCWYKLRYGNTLLERENERKDESESKKQNGGARVIGRQGERERERKPQKSAIYCIRRLDLFVNNQQYFLCVIFINTGHIIALSKEELLLLFIQDNV